MILVTGGCGYIGSHLVAEVAVTNSQIVVLDNLSSSNKKSLQRVSELVNFEFVHLPTTEHVPQIPSNCICLVEGDIADEILLAKVFSSFEIESVIHLAGSKSVNESVTRPLLYYSNNVNGTLVLLRVMSDFNCKSLIFSSSASVYGSVKSNPISESQPTDPLSPYGRSKAMIETILRDLSNSDHEWSIVILRYFNPVGAHPSGRIGESPVELPNNLFPYISKVASGELAKLYVYGNDYETPDGSGVRDYIHVMDLVSGHVCALQYSRSNQAGFDVFNLGTGIGYSVLEVVREYEGVSGKKVPYSLSPRRSGDVAECYADPTLANAKLQWSAVYSLRQMCEDSWRWQVNNPKGYLE